MGGLKRGIWMAYEKYLKLIHDIVFYIVHTLTYITIHLHFDHDENSSIDTPRTHTHTHRLNAQELSFAHLHILNKQQLKFKPNTSFFVDTRIYQYFVWIIFFSLHLFDMGKENPLVHRLQFRQVN
jgi:hypothetical protein